MIATFTLNASIDRCYVVTNVRHGSVNRVETCACTAGGKGLNVARVLHTLGEPVLAGGMIGGDAGRYILRRLEQEGIAHRFTSVAEESRSCINILDLATGTQTEYLEPGMQVCETEIEAFLRDFDMITDKCKTITMSGSLPKGMKTSTYAALCVRAQNAGCRVLLDASGAALENAIGSNPYYIKPNEVELAALSGCDVQKEENLALEALRLHRLGVENVVVSLGHRGALLACEEGLLKGTPPHIRTVNTVGCGDAMTAAFASASAHDMSPAEALRYAIAVSAASALSPDTGGLNLAIYQALKPQVQIYTY